MSDFLDKILTNAASGMSAQSIRLNTIASNLANASSVGNSEQTTYHAKYPIFSEVKHAVSGLSDQDQPIGGVRVTQISQSKKPLERHYEPSNPLADKDGFVYVTNVNPIEEMTNMIAASKEYEANVSVEKTTENLIIQSIEALR